MIPHNQTRQSVKIRCVRELLKQQRPRQTLLQLAQQYQRREPEAHLDIAPHPLPTRNWFHYDFIIEDDEQLEEEKRVVEERRARVRENDKTAADADGSDDAATDSQHVLKMLQNRNQSED